MVRERVAQRRVHLGAGDDGVARRVADDPVSYTHLRAHETVLDLVCRLLLEKKNIYSTYIQLTHVSFTDMI